MTARWATITLVTWVAFSAALAVTDARPAVFALGGVVAVASVVVLLVFGLGRETRPVRWTTSPPTRLVRVDERVRAFGHLMRPENQRLTTELVDTLVDLIDEREQAAGATPPHRVPVHTEELRRTLHQLRSTRRRRVMSHRDVRDILREIETR